MQHDAAISWTQKTQRNHSMEGDYSRSNKELKKIRKVRKWLQNEYHHHLHKVLKIITWVPILHKWIQNSQGFVSFVQFS